MRTCWGPVSDTVDLSPFVELQSLLARVHDSGDVTQADAAAVCAALEGAELQCASGLTLTVLYVADEGRFMRTAGPHRLSMVPPQPTGMNDHGPATSVHADQDVFGTPVRQLMDGEAPRLFRHDSPGVHNHQASLMLVNLWIPLQQITQPLVLADGRSIDRRSHQLRYGLATDSFLERDDDSSINDIWVFLHDPDQRWYFRSEMDHRSALVFNTLSTPHGAGVLPGEDLAERCYRALEAGEASAERGDAPGLVDALNDVNGMETTDELTPALRRAVDAMLKLADEGAFKPRRGVRPDRCDLGGGLAGRSPERCPHVARVPAGGVDRGGTTRPRPSLRVFLGVENPRHRCPTGVRVGGAHPAPLLLREGRRWNTGSAQARRSSWARVMTFTPGSPAA